MRLEVLGTDACAVCGARLFFGQRVCLRENKHPRFLPLNRNGRKGKDEGDIRSPATVVPYLRDAADSRGDDLDLPESA